MIPHAVSVQRTGYYALDTTAILATAVNAIKEQEAKLADQSKEIADLKIALQAAKDREAAQRSGQSSQIKNSNV